MRATLGKLHYIQGDLKSFFYRNKQNDALPYFKKAAELMPENPYYQLRHFELARDERCNNVRTQLSERGHLHMEHYNMWMIKRWNQNPVTPEEFDIHSIKPEAQGMLSRLGRRLFDT